VYVCRVDAHIHIHITDAIEATRSYIKCHRCRLGGGGGFDTIM